MATASREGTGRRPGAARPRASPFLRAAALLGACAGLPACGSTLPPLPAVPAGMVRSVLPPAPPGGYSLDISYSLLPGDKIAWTVREDEGLNFEIVVPPEGEIEIWKSEPGDGRPRQTLPVTGLTVTQVRDRITDIYARTRFQSRPYVQVTLVESVPRVLYIQGAVKTTGVVPLPRTGSRMTLLRAIQAAGGEADDADLSRVQIKRRDPATGGEVSIPVYDLEAMKEQAAFDRDPPLEPNDIVNVPKLGRVWIQGNIGAPGSYSCKRGMTLMKLISEAGDLKPFSKKSDIHVTRGEATVDERYYSVDYGAILDGKALDPILLPNDRVWIDEDWK